MRSVFLAWLALAPLAAQEQAEIVTRDEQVVFRSSANLVLVPVVVRDRNGRAVETLRKGDFRLTDSGKPQEITRFSVEDGSKPPASGEQPATVQKAAENAAAAPELIPEPQVAAAPERFVIYLFDDVHTEAGDLLRARAVAARRLAADMNPTDRAAIFTVSGVGMLDFTGDRERLQQALSRVTPRTPMPAGICETTYYIGESYLRGDPDADAFLTYKAYECQPNYQPRPRPDPVKISIAMAGVNSGERDTRLALYALFNAIERLAAMPGQRLIALVSPGFLARDMAAEKNAILERAARARVTVNAFDPRGVYVVMNKAAESGAAIRPPRPPGRAVTTQKGAEAEAKRQSELPIGSAPAAALAFAIKQAEAMETEAVLGELADGTGGILFHNDNDLDAGFRIAASAPECVYLLAFAPQNLKYDGRFHRIGVTVTGKRHYAVQARRGYYAPNRLESAEEQAREEIREAVFSREEAREIPLEVRTHYFKPDEDSARVTVTVRMDVRQLRFRKTDGRNHDVVTVIIALFDRDGKYVGGHQQTLTLKLKDETLAERLNSGLSLRSSFNVATGPYQVRAVIRDSEGQLMAARNAAVDIP